MLHSNNSEHETTILFDAVSIPNSEGRKTPTWSCTKYEYDYSHGALTGVYDDGRDLVPGSVGEPGIEYNLAGGMSLLRYGNGLETNIDTNAAYLPHNIRVLRSGGTVFTTGVYDYDGARNIKQIGTDLYRYDAAGRLDWARVFANGSPLDLDYTYDTYGNMKSRTTTGGPDGLNFSGRTYANNQLENTVFDFEYDTNGNLIKEPTHENVGGYRYHFSPENRIGLVQALNGDGQGESKIYQESQYDTGGHRWVRVVSADGGQGLVTLRDASGQVASEYLEKDANSGLELQKEYARGNGRLLAVNSACGPRPLLELDSPARQNGNFRFVKTDYVAPAGDYVIYIEATSGQTNTLTRDENLANQFQIAESEFFQGQNNSVRIQADAECGHTGYSNAVSLHYTYTPPDCLTATGSNRTGFGGDGSSSMKLTSSNNCDPTMLFNLYFRDAGTGQTIQLNPGPLFGPEAVLPTLPAGAGHGDYWFTPVDPVTGEEGAPGPEVTDDERSTASDTGGVPGYPSVNPQYVHWDHLGSTRLMTDEKGVTIGEWKYYPFGHEAEATGGRGNRMKFTGHERDDRLGLDYMLARYYGASLGRFMSVDPVNGTPPSPQSWNRYAYVSNNPLVLVDPLGMDEERNEAAEKAGFYENLTSAVSTVKEKAEELGEGAVQLWNETAEQREGLAQSAEGIAEITSLSETAGLIVSGACALGGAEPMAVAGGSASALLGRVSATADIQAALISPTWERGVNAAIGWTSNGLGRTLGNALRRLNVIDGTLGDLVVDSVQKIRSALTPKVEDDGGV